MKKVVQFFYFFGQMLTKCVIECYDTFAEVSLQSETCRLDSLAIYVFGLQSCFYIIKAIKRAIFQTITSLVILLNSRKLVVQAQNFVNLSSTCADTTILYFNLTYIKKLLGTDISPWQFLVFNSICVCLLKFIPKLVFTSKYIIFMSLFGLNAQFFRVSSEV